MQDLIGRTLGHYRIVEKIGEGGMGEVYRAHDERLDRDVAVKVLPEAVAGNIDRLRRFEREAKAVAKLDHPNILAIHDFSTEEGITYAVMELLKGDSLREIISESGLSTGKAMDYARSIADGLAAAHDKGIIHRDLKPENVFLINDGRIKVLDFGLAKLNLPEADLTTETPTETLDTTPGGLIGTVAYMAPEQVQGQPADHRSDIFSLGVVLYELLTGKRPFGGSTSVETAAAILKEAPPPLEDRTDGLSAQLQALMNRLLDKNPARRPQSASEVSSMLETFGNDMGGEPTVVGLLATVGRFIRRPAVVVSVFLGVAAATILGYHIASRAAKVRWAREVAVPEIEKLADVDDYSGAFELARKAERFILNDPVLAGLRQRISRFVSIRTDPPGADLYVKPYPSYFGATWEAVGQSPVEGISLPRAPFWLKVEKPTFESVEALMPKPSVYDLPETVREYELTLDKHGAVPKGMIRVPAKTVTAELYEYELRRELSPYFIDKHEVSNLEFKEFVDSDGYSNQDYWPVPLQIDQKPVSWQEAVETYRDRTGRRGPATWQGGTFPEGHGEYPVAGVSWFEAAAYCRFVAKELPTVSHWHGATDVDLGEFIVPFSNFGSEGLVRVGSYPPGPLGTFDMAGNVREWCLNGPRGLRNILGGAWDDPSYLFGMDSDALPPSNRSTTNGFRCADYPQSEKEVIGTMGGIDRNVQRGVQKSEPVGDLVFSAYASQYEYDPGPLEAVLEEVDDTNQYWTRERIVLNAAYDGEKLITFLFVPKGVEPPFQTVVYFPGATALRKRSSDDLQIRIVDFFVMNGRAVLYPIYKGTQERYEDLKTSSPNDSKEYAEYVIKWVNDARRSIDYLETRDDIDSRSLAYLGYSWGGRLGSIVLALEPRLRVGIFLAGGLWSVTPRPEVYALNYAPRVNVPVLMVNGAHDGVFPLEESQKPLFNLLGSSDENKKHIIYETGHSFGRYRNQSKREMLAWLDQYLGPVH